MRAGTLSALKQVVRRTVVDPLHRSLDDVRLRNLIGKLRKSGPDRALLEALHRAWGNESFAADVSYIGELIARVEHCTGPILECGSGLTTIVAAVAGENRRLSIVSLEQDAGWLAFVKKRLEQNDISNVDLKFAPVRQYDGYVWYDLDALQLPKGFELMLCDGPFVSKALAPMDDGWRYGALPVLAGKGIRVDGILFDDVDDTRAARVLRRWQQEFGVVASVVHARDGDYAFLTTCQDREAVVASRDTFI